MMKAKMVMNMVMNDGVNGVIGGFHGEALVQRRRGRREPLVKSPPYITLPDSARPTLALLFQHLGHPGGISSTPSAPENATSNIKKMGMMSLQCQIASARLKCERAGALRRPAAEAAHNADTTT